MMKLVGHKLYTYTHSPSIVLNQETTPSPFPKNESKCMVSFAINRIIDIVTLAFVSNSH